MKKKIIEKLELPYDDGKGNFSSGSGEIHILRKVNEIIDVLNSWVFEPTLTIPSQSQKQPEGDYVNTEPEKVIVDPIGVDFTTEGKNREFPVEYKTREEIDKMFKPEKQEEWREELCKICDSTSCYSISGEDYVVRATFKFEELVNFISQLLSEREKEVAMEIRGKFWEESEEDFGTYIEEKLSKLLKEGNGRE